MYIEVTKSNGRLERFDNVDKVIFHDDCNSVEYSDHQCINHTSSP